MKKTFGLVLALLVCGVLICSQVVEESRGTELIKETFDKYAIPFENQKALLIGIDKYQYIRKLNNAVFDVQTIRDILIDKYGYKKKNIVEMYDSEATWENIRAELRSVSKSMTDKDSLLIYFAGHGYLDKAFGRGYWLPVDCGKSYSQSEESLIDDSKLNNMPRKIHSADIHDIMGKCKAKHIFVIADSCYSGKFLNPNREAAGNLSSYYYKRSRHVLASGRGIVSDGRKGEHSPFARVLISFLINNSEENIFASQLIAHVKKIVERNHRQRPFGSAVRNVGDEDGEFILFLKNDVYLAQVKTDFRNFLSSIESDGLSVSEKIRKCTAFQETYKGEFFQRLSKRLEEIKDIFLRVEGIKGKLEKQKKPKTLNAYKGWAEDILLLKKRRSKILTLKKHGNALQSTLQYLDEVEDGKNAILHYLVDREQVSVVFTTSTSQLVKTNKIISKKLNRMIVKYRIDVRNLGEPLGKGKNTSKGSIIYKELYDIIFKSVDEELKKSEVTNIMVFLDGVLKYISLGALWDGEAYLLQRYRFTLLTTSSLARIEREPTDKMKILFLGVSKGGNKFSSLPYVKEEIRSIVRNHENGYIGLIEGKSLIDDHFSKETMFAQLKSNAHNIVHISSHFKYSAGDETKSFLQLGDDSILTLSELRAQKNIFGGVELIVLAACDTGIGGSNIKEIDGFAELVQQLGAQSVIAALWKIRDRSTKDFMVAFYRNLKGRKVTSKFEALRQAQLELAGLQDLLAKGKKRSKQNTEYSAPYYWGPFVMIGNWR